MRPLENLSRLQRQGTPLLFALHLVGRLRAMFEVENVSALWVAEKSIYHAVPDVDCWPQSRDARRYDGPGPVVCHPPCGPWGKYRSNCFHSRSDGVKAMEIAHRFGGVVEQPVGSALFAVHGRTGIVERVNQGDFGHLALKPTLLYWCYIRRA